MKRIQHTFESLRKAGRKGLVGYLTAGDPDFDASEKHLRTALKAGVDVLELGVPFSDPTADGPIIQAAALRALTAGMSVRRSLELVRHLRKNFDQPIILFGYANPFFLYGFQRLAADAAAAGADGMLVVDLPHEESDELREALRSNGLCFIPLIAPTTPDDRMREILRDANGFVYYIMVTGVTGARDRVVTDVAAHVSAVRKHTRLPVAVGFGVSRGDQARQVAQGADAVVVGSALVKAAGEGRLEERVKDLRAGLDGVASK